MPHLLISSHWALECPHKRIWGAGKGGTTHSDHSNKSYNSSIKFISKYFNFYVIINRIVFLHLFTGSLLSYVNAIYFCLLVLYQSCFDITCYW